MKVDKRPRQNARFLKCDRIAQPHILGRKRKFSVAIQYRTQKKKCECKGTLYGRSIMMCEGDLIVIFSLSSSTGHAELDQQMSVPLWGRLWDVFGPPEDEKVF